MEDRQSRGFVKADRLGRMDERNAGGVVGFFAILLFKRGLSPIRTSSDQNSP
jgi:hypothetical protein